MARIAARAAAMLTGEVAWSAGGWMGCSSSSDPTGGAHGVARRRPHGAHGRGDLPPGQGMAAWNACCLWQRHAASGWYFLESNWQLLDGVTPRSEAEDYLGRV